MGLALTVGDVSGHRVRHPAPALRLVPPLGAPRLRRPPASIVVREIIREPARPEAGRVDEEDAERWDGLA